MWMLVLDQTVWAFRTCDLTEAHSSLGQTLALHIFFHYVVISLVYCQMNANRTIILYGKIQKKKDWTLRTLVNQGYGNKYSSVINRTVWSIFLVDP